MLCKTICPLPAFLYFCILVKLHTHTHIYKYIHVGLHLWQQDPPRRSSGTCRNDRMSLQHDKKTAEHRVKKGFYVCTGSKWRFEAWIVLYSLRFERWGFFLQLTARHSSGGNKCPLKAALKAQRLFRSQHQMSCLVAVRHRWPTQLYNLKGHSGPISRCLYFIWVILILYTTFQREMY